MKKYNNLVNNSLSIGQILLIPEEEKEEVNDEYKLYTIKSGDSLYKIASANNITVKELMDYNNLTSTNLQIGQTLLIPIIKEEEILDEYITYTVQSGDSLYSIARKFNTTVSELRNFNDLKTDLLSIGQVLRIPIKDVESDTETSSYIEYIVKSGDSLYAIANKYDTSVNELKEYNNLSSNLLNIGQIIRIPITTSEVIYVVQSGDTLYSIANKFNTSVNSIKNKNNLTNNLLNVGQKLII